MFIKTFWLVKFSQQKQTFEERKKLIIIAVSKVRNHEFLFGHRYVIHDQKITFFFFVIYIFKITICLTFLFVIFYSYNDS